MYGHPQQRYNQAPPNIYQPYPNHPPANAYPHQNYQVVGGHGQPMAPPSLNKNQQRSSIKGNNYQFPGPNAALMQPPALNLEQPMDTNSQFFQQRGPMTISNNQHSEFDAHQQMQEDAIQQAQIASMFWEQRCMTMLERFEWFYQRFQILKNQHLTLSEQMQKMDSEEEWHIFQQHHQEFHQKMQEMQQQITAVLGENQQLLLQKKSQDSESVWEQRYQQLLGNFKSLQEQMVQIQANGGKGTTADYRQLQQHCAELQYQYEQALNELKMYRQGGHTADMEQQINAYIEELQTYKDKINNLHSENVELQQMLGQYQNQNQQLKHEKYKSNVDRNQFDQLMRQVEQKQQQIHSLQREFKNKSASNSAISQYEQTLQEKIRQIEELKRTINEKDNQINIVNRRVQQLQDSNDRQSKKYAAANNQYEQKISNLKTQIQKQAENGLRVQNLQRKLTYSNQQVSNLNETLRKKNQELIQLRGLSLQVEKLKEAQAQLIQTVDQRNRLADLVKKKGQELQKMHIETEKLNAIIAQNNNKRQQYSARNLRIEIQDLAEQVRKRQAELNKLKSITTLKDQYGSKMQEQSRHWRQKYTLIEQILQTERESWNEKQLRSASKGNNHNERMRQLDHEFNVQIKDTLEKQVTVLRKQNAYKQESIRGLEEKTLLLQSQLSIYLKQEDNHNKELSLFKQKQVELLSKINSQNKQSKDIQTFIKSKDEDIWSAQQKYREALQYSQSLKLQIQEHQQLIKLNSATIKELHQQLKLSVSRQAQIEKVAVENSSLRKAIQRLQAEKQQQQQLGVSKSKVLSINNSKRQLNEQQNVIGQLLCQNQFLKDQIAKLISQSNNYPANNSSDLNKRLNEFNHKLHMTISNPQSQAHLSRSQSGKTIALWEKERSQLINHYEQQIHALKQKLQNKLNGSQASGLANSKKIFYNGLQSQQLKEQIAFLKQKSSQLQERNKHLITLNEELKQKLNSIYNIKQNTPQNYYKTQLQKAETEKQNLKEKLAKILEQNRQFKLQLTSKNTKLTQGYEFKIMQLQLKIQEQNRRIALLFGERATSTIQKASYQHDQKIRQLAHNLNKKEGATPKSNITYKSGIREQMGAIMASHQLNSYQYRQPMYSFVYVEQLEPGEADMIILKTPIFDVYSNIIIVSQQLIQMGCESCKPGHNDNKDTQTPVMKQPPQPSIDQIIKRQKQIALTLDEGKPKIPHFYCVLTPMKLQSQVRVDIQGTQRS